MGGITLTGVEKKFHDVAAGKKNQTTLAAESWNKLGLDSIFPSTYLTYKKIDCATGFSYYTIERKPGAPMPGPSSLFDSVANPSSAAEDPMVAAAREVLGSAAPQKEPEVAPVKQGPKPLRKGYVKPKEWAIFEKVFNNTYCNIWLTGHAGTGKDAMVHEMAAISGKKLFQINCRQDMNPEVFFGHWNLEGGGSSGAPETKFYPGVVEEAMTEGGILFLNEAAAMPAEVAIALNRVLEEDEERTFVIDVDKKHREVKSAPGFKIILASNTIGRGFDSQTAAYTAQSNELDGSIHSRISCTIKMDFNTNLEKRILEDMFPGNHDVVKHFTQFIKSLRKANADGFMAMPFSTRNLLAIARMYICGLTLKESLECAYFSHLTADERSVAEEHIIPTLGREDYETL